MNELTELTEVHLKILSDITALQKNIMSSQSQIETLRITLKKIETTLWQKRVEEVRLSQDLLPNNGSHMLIKQHRGSKTASKRL
ncbi:hypothetical protein RINTU1_19000 [Candidatus Regiella insecticola]|uniref:Uncharacterized protein n=1 Tax=Candidatus Regiella insecticola TaxID=138073 RepID=A0A6L2ZPA5_9ENTR|nr:hypothetical protein RINTU1_19000 [Candidatus Regiella insecticola]